MFRKTRHYTVFGDLLPKYVEGFFPRLCIVDEGGGGAGAGDGDTGGDGGVGGDNGSGTGDDGTKPATFTQADIDAAIAKATSDADAKIQTAIEDAEKKAKMSADEKAKYEADKKTQELSDREIQLNLRELKADAVTELAKNGLPSDILDMVVADNKENTTKNIEAFKAMFDKAVQAKVDERLKGNPPASGGDGAPKETNSLSDAIAFRLGGN